MFNLYRNWAQLILRHPSDALVILLIREGVIQGDPLSMFLYDITLVPLSEKLRDAYPTLISPFYADDAAFDGLTQRSAAKQTLVMDWEPDRGYFPDLAKVPFY